jgi:hypothetical protein
MAGLLLMTPTVALAHRPYSYEVAAITDQSGRKLHIFKAFTDGIILPDPVTLEVRDTDGQTVAQSPRLIDVAVLCRDGQSCLAFGYDAAWFVFVPIEVWQISGPQLTPVTTPRMRAAGVAIHIWQNWFGYLVALASVLVPLAILQRIQRLPEGPARHYLQIAAALVGALFLLPWYFMIAFSNLSIMILVVAGVSVALASRWLGLLGWATGGPTRG